MGGRGKLLVFYTVLMCWLIPFLLQSVPICCWPTMHQWRWRMLRDGARLQRLLATEIDKWVSIRLFDIVLWHEGILWSVSHLNWSFLAWKQLQSTDAIPRTYSFTFCYLPANEACFEHAIPQGPAAFGVWMKRNWLVVFLSAHWLIYPKPPIPPSNLHPSVRFLKSLVLYC